MIEPKSNMVTLLLLLSLEILIKQLNFQNIQEYK